MTSKAGIGTRAQRFVARYLHTLRAKIPALRPAFAKYEMRRFVANLMAHGATDSDIASLRRELDLVWHAALPNC